jgi:hypothetical protein
VGSGGHAAGGCDRWVIGTEPARNRLGQRARPYATRAINSISTGILPGSTVVPIALRA